MVGPVGGYQQTPVSTVTQPTGTGDSDVKVRQQEQNSVAADDIQNSESVMAEEKILEMVQVHSSNESGKSLQSSRGTIIDMVV